MDKSSVKRCGIIMPIASMPGYSAEHWSEVKSIIIEATSIIEGIKFKTDIVSDSDGEIDVIHKRIVQNIYNADIVVCDISGRNPNVMFELGMRLTFDKPTIIIKDDETDFIFDTGVIEHITYPKDLRFSKVVHFKEELARRIKATYEKAQSTPDFSTFLGNFGQFKVPSLDQKTISEPTEFLLEELSLIRRELTSVKKEVSASKNYYSDSLVVSPTEDYKFKKSTESLIKDKMREYVSKNKKNKFLSPEEIFADKEFKKYLLENSIRMTSNSKRSDTLLKLIEEVQEEFSGG